MPLVSASTTLLSVAHHRTSHDRSYRLRSIRSMFVSAMSESRVPRTLVPMMSDSSAIDFLVLVANSLATPDVFSESVWTSPATTLNAAPASPARAASIRALSASSRVFELMSLISLIASVSMLDRSVT